MLDTFTSAIVGVVPLNIPTFYEYTLQIDVSQHV